MTDDRSTVADDELKDWFRLYVSPELEESKAAEVVAEHVPELQRGVLAWFADHFVPDDPASLILPDGPGDGGSDIVSIVSSESRNHIRIFQCSAPAPENVAEGRLSTKKTKFGDDVRELRNNVIGKSRRLKQLNSTAQDVIRQVNGMRELAAVEDTPTPLTIEIQPLTLRVAHPDARRELDDLAVEAREGWSTENEQWVVHDVLDARDLYLRWRRRRSKSEAPTELKFVVFGDVAKDHPDRGPFLCFLRAGDVLSAYEQWGAGLLDANLRYSLGKSEVNKTIETELERLSAIKWFHEKNNGLVLICDKCVIAKDTIRLFAPQVVNGGQTLHSLGNVVRDLESIPLEARTSEDTKRLSALRSDLRLSVRVVTVSGGNPNKPDQISIASNTQNKLSERTMRSSAVEMRTLRLSLAALPRPWYLVTKDGEWSAVTKRKSLFQSKTGNRQPVDFKDGGRYRRLENSDAAVAMMSFLGFLDEARASRVFKQTTFLSLFASRPSSEAWQRLSSSRLEWRGHEFGELFEHDTIPAPTWLLAYFLWSFWKAFTFPESQQILRALEEAGAKDREFHQRHCKTSGWDMSDEARDTVLRSVDSCYWREHIAKSTYLALVYQSMRVFQRCYGPLDEATCVRILQLREFDGLFSGTPASSMIDFRQGSLSDGPLTALGRILLYACELLWQRHEAAIRVMPSRQQTLIQREWVDRLGSQVDLILDRLHKQSFRHSLEGPRDGELELANATDLFR